MAAIAVAAGPKDADGELLRGSRARECLACLARKRPRVAQETFTQRKAKLLGRQGARAAAAAGLSGLTIAEEALERAVLHPAVLASRIDPAKNFLEHKGDYDASPVLPLLRRMPKGAVLHTHGIASGDFRVLVDALQKDGHFFVWRGDDSVTEGTMRAFAAGSVAGKGWVAAQDCPSEVLYGYLTLSPGLPSVERCWEEFGQIWERIRLVACVAPFYFGRGGFLWSILAGYRASNVMYVEIKEPVFAPWTEYDGEPLADGEVLERFRDTVAQFRGEHPDFLGARMVLTGLKSQSEEEVRAGFRRAADMKEQLPDFVAGFDLAGPEDVLKPIQAFAAVLEEERAAAARRGVDLPLLLHAGETNVPEGAQIFDAVLLGCERIGHGFALARHPELLDEVLASGISLECCPISNQVLGYCPNLANHAALGLMRAGVPLTISPDDPGMWHYSDVSYDFAAIAKAWNLGLLEVKALARNSLACSTLRGCRREEALAAWEARWQQWVTEELHRAGA